MDVRIAAARDADLDDVCYIGEVHTAGCDVGGHENSGISLTEMVSSAGALYLTETRVYLINAGVSQFTGSAEVEEDFVSESHFGSGAEVHNGFEWALPRPLRDSFDFTLAQFQDCGEEILETLAGNQELLHAFVSWHFIGRHCLDIMQIRLHGSADKVDNLVGDGGGVH